MTVPDDVRSVPVVGLPLAVTITTGVFLLLSLFGVGTRIFVGYRRKVLGLDDGLVLLSSLTFIGVFGLTLHGATIGVGTKNSGLNDWLQAEGGKYYTIWILVYLSGMAMVKSSVSVTLLRILPPTQTKMRICVWSLMCLSWASWCVAFSGVLLLCRPVEASWDKALVAEGTAECGGTGVLVGISQTVTACSVVTDVGCTVLPGVMLWNTAMTARARREIFVLLSIASVASIATIARAPYLSHYSDPTDNLLYYCGYMVLFSNVETGIGCFASSLPALRRLYYTLVGPDDDDDDGPEPGGSVPDGHGLVTIGGTGGRKGSRPRLPALRTLGSVFTSPTDRGESQPEAHLDVAGGRGRWDPLADEGSEMGILVPQPENNRISAQCSYSV